MDNAQPTYILENNLINNKSLTVVTDSASAAQGFGGKFPSYSPWTHFDPEMALKWAENICVMCGLSNKPQNFYPSNVYTMVYLMNKIKYLLFYHSHKHSDKQNKFYQESSWWTLASFCLSHGCHHCHQRMSWEWKWQQTQRCSAIHR